VRTRTGTQLTGSGGGLNAVVELSTNINQHNRTHYLQRANQCLASTSFRRKVYRTSNSYSAE